MPELPEVEVTRRSIAEPLRGARVLSVRVGKPLRWPLGCAPHMLAGATVGDVLRRGKYLWLPLLRNDVATVAVPAPDTALAAHVAADTDADAPASGGLLMHLGMSGSLALLGQAGLAGRAPDPGIHDHFDLVTDRGTLRLNDPRRFGAVVWSSGMQQAPAAKLLQGLGPEPFDAALTPQGFHAALHKRSAPIKAVLLDGAAVVGAGNIYACEALFLAGIHPALAASRISRPRAERLLAALRLVLGRALELGGSTLRDFSDAHGVSGAYQSQAHVYGRAGQPCLRCGSAIKRVVQAQRSTFFCAVCQRR